MKATFSKILSVFDKMGQQTAIQALLVGVLGGFFSIIYRLILETAGKVSFYPWVYLLIPVIGWILAKVLSQYPDATGSGVSQTEAAVLFGHKLSSLPILWIRYIAGAIGILFGLSLGRGGPSIQIGACGGQMIAKATRANPSKMRCLIVAGAAAGLSATFNAPLSGILFVLEEVCFSFSKGFLLSVALASLSASYLSQLLLGFKPVLLVSGVKALPLEKCWWIILLGVMAGLVGLLINCCLLSAQKVCQSFTPFQKVTLILLLSLPVMVLCPQLLGSGYQLMVQIPHMKLALHLAIFYLLGKIFFTSACFGSAFPGGIFTPILSMGALSGAVFGLLIHAEASTLPVLSICAMAAVLSATLKRPLVSIILVLELTGSIQAALWVTGCVLVAWLVTQLFKMPPIYETLLERYLSNQPIEGS